MSVTIPDRGAGRVFGVLVSVAGAVILAHELAPDSAHARELVADICVIVAALASAVALVRTGAKSDAWEGTVPFAVAMVVMASAKLLDMASTLGYIHISTPRYTDLFFLVTSGLFLVPVWGQFREHFHPEDRKEIAADIALIATSLVGVVYLLLRPGGPNEAVAAIAWSAVFAATAAAAIAAYITVALWVPSIAHVARLMVIGAFAAGTLMIGSGWIVGSNAWMTAPLDLVFSLAALALAGISLLAPAQAAGMGVVAETSAGRALLTTVAVAATAVSLGVIAGLEVGGTAKPPEATLLIALLAAAIAARVFLNQVRSAQAKGATTQALYEKEEALREAGEAMTWLREAIDTLTASEQRLRLLFDAAVDGVVEVDGGGIVRRANDAFCAMVELDRERVVGSTWEKIASTVRGGGSSLSGLAEAGEATLNREGQQLFLEARTSQIPGSPPGLLMLVRDVTAAKVADQTIRSLFKFLQDRDEDRTRILKRTNSAIESERNRIARDLHDGPVQGVSAASLSLEAVLLMLRAGDEDRAVDTLVKVRNQLSEEADNLRRLMGNLRPPLLEERGLIPALQETLARFGRDAGIKTAFRSRSLVDLPSDLETLAYRLVQEALSNARKHSRASRVTVTVDAVAGQLRVEVEDDGVGFDTSRARDFLRMGKVGLASMRERIELANGTFMVRSSERNGTTVVAILPLEGAAAPQEMAAT